MINDSDHIINMKLHNGVPHFWDMVPSIRPNSNGGFGSIAPTMPPHEYEQFIIGPNYVGLAA